MISNSSPLIFLSKINQLSLLKKLFENIIISKEVKDEVLIKDKIDSIYTDNAIKEGWIRVVESGNVIPLGIKGAEASVINLAIERKDKLIVDDAVAMKIASAFGVKTIRTTTIVLMAIKKKFIAKKQAISLINNLIESGYYISPSHYALILEKLSS